MLYALLATALATDLCAQRPIINEFLAENDVCRPDEQGEFDDWIEIFNPTGDPIYIGGWHISDDPAQPAKWQIPYADPDSLLIEPGGFLLLWADGEPEQGALHIGFQLDGGGEFIGLYEPDGLTLADSLSFGNQNGDISFGRIVDGIDDWGLFHEPTPGAPNTTGYVRETSQKPKFSHKGGLYSEAITLELSVDAPKARIFYTLDGSTPNANSQLYAQPIVIGSTTVVRARAFAEGRLPSHAATHTFVMSHSQRLPVISLALDSTDFWGPAGIYTDTNRAKGWEKFVSIEFYEPDGAKGFRQDAGIKIHAPDLLDQQSLRIIARDRYGKKRMDHRIFSDKRVTAFKQLILRRGGNDGVSFDNGVHMRDGLNGILYGERRPENSYAAYRSARVLLNGRDWGVYNIRERLDEHFLAGYRGVDSSEFLELQFAKKAITGNWQRFNALMLYVDKNDLSHQGHYDFVAGKLDLDDYIEYWAYETYIANFDWLTNNIFFWRDLDEPEDRYKWILWDTDHGLGLQFPYNAYPSWNTIQWATDTAGLRREHGNSTLLIRNLLENRLFKNMLINRFADLMNTVFLPAHAQSKIDSLKTLLDADIDRQFEIWSGNRATWESRIETLKTYLNERPAHVRRHIMEEFGPPGYSTVTVEVDPPDAGEVRINTIEARQPPFSGVYFHTVPVPIEAIPRPGYVFAGWSHNNSGARSEFTLDGDMNITAFFREDTCYTRFSPGVVINEINYNSKSDFDTEDWLELYNAGPEPVDLANWTLRNAQGDIVYAFPRSVAIPADGYALVVRDTAEFNALLPQSGLALGNLEKTLDNNGDQLLLYNAEGALVDSVVYADSADWPRRVDGRGPTLELINGNLDNTCPSSWSASRQTGGTPGARNGVWRHIPLPDPCDTTTVNPYDACPVRIEQVVLRQNFPNPYRYDTTIEYDLPADTNVRLSVYDAYGRLIVTLVDEMQTAGAKSVVWDSRDANGREVAKGAYFYRLETGAVTLSAKLLLVE